MRQRARACVATLAAVVLASALPSPARANDRPYLLTSSAAAEEDDDAVWALEAWGGRAGSTASLTVAPEYAFDPLNSLQLELTLSRGGATEAELEYKHLFNHIGRDGWGWGFDATGSSQGAVALKLLYSVALLDGDALLHVNGGMLKARNERREWVGSVAFEHRLPWRSSAFFEWGREEGTTLLHAGVRHWIQRERLAFDVSVQQFRAGSERSTGVVVGLAWYDL